MSARILIYALSLVVVASCGDDEPVSCTAGELDCKCKEGDLCGPDLVCQDAHCVTPACTLGSAGCGCTAAGTCSDDTLHCDSERICTTVSAGCSPGARDCTCDGGQCAAGLMCFEDRVCVDATGYQGGPCFGGGSCFAGNRCVEGVCGPCNPGTQACGCLADGSCNAGLECLAGSCVATNGLALNPPIDGQCYSTCTNDLIDGADVRPCVGGFVTGCVGDTECQRGQCVASGGSRRTCAIDLDCPHFNTCLEGYCTPNCDGDADCQTGAICHAKVCRLACSLDGEPCPDDLACELVDGQSGACMQQLPGSTDHGSGLPAEPDGLTLTPSALSLTSGIPDGSFELANDSELPITYRVTKLSHEYYNDDVLTSVQLGRVSHELAPADTCVAGTIGCRCAGPAKDTCGALPTGQTMECSAVAGQSDKVCRPPTCTTDDEPGCVCHGDDCLRYCAGASCPLFWVELSVTAADGTTMVEPTPRLGFDVTVPAGEHVLLNVGAANASVYDWWGGTVRVADVANGREKIATLGYTHRPEARWNGEVYYFGDFRVSEAGLKTWMEGGRRESDIPLVHNAFIQAWASFRRQRLDLAKFKALLTATRTESWRTPEMRARCPVGTVCYPYADAKGYLTYTLEPDSEPVPSGVVELPLALDLRFLGSSQFKGNIVSSHTLQYPGDPAFTLQFANDPTTCSVQGEAGCIVFIDDFTFESVLGARRTGASCPGRLEQTRVPWLVPGFLAGATFDADDGAYYMSECRDPQTPLAPSTTSAKTKNRALAQANPVADGEVRKRTIELIDGALVNTDTLFIIFRETMESWIAGGDDIVSYGYMVLERQEQSPEEATPVPPIGNTGIAPPVPACDAAMLDDLGVSDSDPPADIARLLLDGVVAERRGGPLEASGDEQVHYLCVETGELDGGSGATPHACPAGSDVTYFTVSRALLSDNAVKTDSCQTAPAHCADALTTWRSQAGRVKQVDPYWLCADHDLAYCSSNRTDLRADKVFYAAPSGGAPVMARISTAVDDAFRYRTRFQSRSGTTLGFVPELCLGDSDAIPYCYDAEAMEQISLRVDCLLHLYVTQGSIIKGDSSSTYADLKAYLTESFAYAAKTDPSLNITVYHSGFEKLFAELLIMLGDDRYTKAHASRFDLAGLSIAAFQGSLFEADGINLSGVAGAEMWNLYSAVQHYGLALDRFFRLLPEMQASLALPPSEQIIDSATVEEYLGRLIRASAQKARAHAEIAKRYQSFNRPDLARAVIERAYVAGYLESMVFTHLMQNIVDVSAVEDRAQIVRAIQTAQLSYRVALSDMRTQYESITEDIDYFGFPADYIPFPAVEAAVARDNGFEVAASRAWQRIQMAQQAEEAAIAASRSFDTDAASFQNELTRVENTYEAQLSDLCGTFEANDKVYPAIRKFAYLDPTYEQLGDPCGHVGNGQIQLAAGEVDTSALRIEQVRQQMLNVLAEAASEQQRMDEACATKRSWEQTLVSVRGRSNTLQGEIDDAQRTLSQLDRKLQTAKTIYQLYRCMTIVGVAAGTDCPASIVSAVGFGIAAAAIDLASYDISGDINDKQEEIRDLQLQESKITYDFCNTAGTSLVQIDSAARIRSILLRLKELQLDALQADYGLRQSIARLRGVQNQARRVEAEMNEMTQLTLNVEAARNNPNVRIYKNDAVINADVTYYAALREVYKATRVYEYYSSQSYAAKEKLFLVRMVNRGDYNLQNYLIELEDAYRLFEDVVGVPDLRLLRVSMRDDILKIPMSRPSGEPYTQAERLDLFRGRLADGTLLDEHGYIVAPFSIEVDDLSPLTRNHKVRNIEAQFVGSLGGDPLARVYVRMGGTSAIRGIGGDMAFYTFPPRTAVVNAYLNTDKPYQPEVYKNTRLAERPLLNGRWELVLNLLDEPDNDDLDLDSLNDINLYFYYADFTEY